MALQIIDFQQRTHMHALRQGIAVNRSTDLGPDLPFQGSGSTRIVLPRAPAPGKTMRWGFKPKYGAMLLLPLRSNDLAPYTAPNSDP